MPDENFMQSENFCFPPNYFFIFTSFMIFVVCKGGKCYMCSVANFMPFPAMKIFWKSNKVWQRANYKVGSFLQCWALRFTDGEISWVAIWVSGWLFFLQMISRDWEGLTMSYLAQRWHLVRGWCAHLDFWKKFFDLVKFAKKRQKCTKNAIFHFNYQTSAKLHWCTANYA